MKTKNTDIKKRTLYQKIVNVFISLFIALLFLIFLFFGISQTSTFRDYLRHTIVEKVNNLINGRLSIEKIEGTLLTSLYLRNAIIISQKDTLLNAETIQLKTSPLKLLFKELLVRKIDLINTNIDMITYKNGSTNLDYVFQSQDSTHNDNTKPFPFIITLSNVSLKNVQFYLHDKYYKDKDVIYDSLTTDNLFIKNINASLAARLDVNNNIYDLLINSFVCKPNIKSFEVKNIKSHITLNNNRLSIDQLFIETSNTTLNLNGEMKKNKLLKALGNNNFGDASINLRMNSPKLDLNEIGIFIPSVLFLDGIVSIDLNTDGLFNNLNVSALDIYIGTSHINIKGDIKNLLNPGALDINANINESILYAKEISQNLKFLNLPEFKELKEIKIDKLSFRGKEFGFISSFNISNNEGKILGNVQMNYLGEQNNYFGEINTQNFSLLPILNIPLKLNSKITIYGSGMDYSSMSSSIKINANNSVYNNKIFNSLNLSSNIKNGKVQYKIDAVSDLTKIKADGNIFKNKNGKINIDIKTDLTNINSYDFINDSSLITNLNLSFIGKLVQGEKGEFNISSNLKLENSHINKTPLYKNDYVINIKGNKDFITNLNVNSSQIDADINGKFTINNTVNLIADEINSLDKIINHEIDKLIFSGDSLLTEAKEFYPKENVNPLNDESMNFSFRFKQFNLESPFKGSDNINISGFLNGNIANKKDSLSISFKSNLDYVKIWGDAGVYFLSDLFLNVNLINTLGLTNFSDLSADINLNTKRIFTGSDIKNIKLNYRLTKGNGSLIFNSEIENKFKINLVGETIFNNLNSSVKLNKLRVNFKKYLVQNVDKIDISYSKDKINFNNFLLSHGKGKLKISGILNRNDNQQLVISLSDINLDDITQNILNEAQFKNIKGVIGLNAKIKGKYLAPQISLGLDINNITIDDQKIGILKSNIDYLNKNINMNLTVVDSEKKLSKPALSISGNLPIDLTLENIKNRIIENAYANIKLTANNFNLITISNIIPEFTNVNGILFADLIFKGRMNNLLPTGIINIQNISFLSDYNNMKYNSRLKFSAENGVINLDSLYISNIEGTTGGGVLTGTGITKLNYYKFTSPKIFLNGQLKILNEASKSVSPLVYGDLVVATQGNAEFIIESDKEYLKAPLLVKRANLTFPQAKPSFKNTRSNFIYKYISDTLNVDRDISSFDNLIKLSRQKDSSKSNVKQETDNLVFDINVNVEDEASIKFVLDKEFNQVLNTNISGDFQYKTIEGIKRAFGTLTLREGSTLDFLTKTFEAGGTLRFENELTNPYLDVVGVYRDYYYEPTIDSTNISSQEKEVAVKVKLIGPLQDLNKNFVKTKDNLAVYYGTENIDKDIPDLTKDASDAIMFIVTGHFSTTEEGFTNTQKTNTLTGTASSIAGSLIGGLLNSYAGDYIRSVELKQVGSYTKFSLSGKVNKFKYTIGGTTEVFQDLSRTNIRIEYPFFQKFFIRVERKESLTESNLLREMINELGLKYKFEF